MKARIAVLLFSMLLFERSHSQEVIASSGNFDSMASGSLSWTLGEIATETVTDGNSFLTQGFQQPFEGGVGIIEQSGNPYIHFFPNPFYSSITILNQGFEGNCQLKFIENSGKI
ncbi:MAG: hypothetical protein RIT43_330, partial [Bacteroidota bacterium]